MDWQPTMHLRRINRTVVERRSGNCGGAYDVATHVEVLQQAWAPSGGGQIEWRDVPLVSSCNCTAYCSKCMPANPINAGRTSNPANPNT